MRLLPTALIPALLSAAGPISFRSHTLATDLKGGYQVVAFDVNRDGRTDLIALASGMTELVWFEAPSWTRHILARDLKRMINLAACPGMEEIVVAHEFANVPKNSIGIVSVLSPGADRTQPWTVREIDRLTTSHRLRCAHLEGSSKIVVVNAPLAGARADAPDYRDRVPLTYYRPGEWKRVTVNEANEGVVHGIYITPWSDKREEILTASFLGLHRHRLEKNGTWTRVELSRGNPSAWPASGSSDVSVGVMGKNTRFLAAIEPWHGNEVAVYRGAKDSWTRTVIDSSLNDGHTIYTGDLDGDGRDEIIAGYRKTPFGVNLYQAEDPSSEKWKKTVLDQGGVAAAACALADLNGDKRLDIACIGSTTTNLVWYENLKKQ
ncbi:MAG TPA: VCBS repeat-containing protein [Bryobacteraceae bacterium]|nr:VCBS repeat-containing protein [Bryobacteraceae bacterium]